MGTTHLEEHGLYPVGGKGTDRFNTGKAFYFDPHLKTETQAGVESSGLDLKPEWYPNGCLREHWKCLEHFLDMFLY